MGSLVSRNFDSTNARGSKSPCASMTLSSRIGATARIMLVPAERSRACPGRPTPIPFAGAGFPAAAAAKRRLPTRGGKFSAALREKSPHGQMGQPREATFCEVASDDGAGSPGIVGGGPTAAEFKLPSAPRTTRHPSPIASATTQRTSGAKHRMLWGANVLASMGTTSTVFVIFGLSLRTCTESTLGVIG